MVPSARKIPWEYNVKRPMSRAGCDQQGIKCLSPGYPRQLGPFR